MRINDYIKKRPVSPENSNENTEEMLNRYSQMNEEQLMQEMFRNAAQSRENGSLNDQMLDDFYGKACAYLTPEQSERMKELIIELKK
ncbi:MAG: hypothetical protein PHI19_01990 [Clostridia bacterium]|nr:hypothetical protein [Clostridia bacterium]